MVGTPPGKETSSPGYTSFVLRCWVGEDGRVHARLIDIRSQVEHVVGNLSRLPGLVQGLIVNAAALEAKAQTGTPSHNKPKQSTGEKNEE